ncbi:MAG TPA: response regulator [Ktedonobacteraceae bacterium]
MTARVMVINDDQAILDLYRLLLEGEGYETHLSMIAMEDVRQIKELAPDCIILDLKLGFGRNGLTLLQQLKMYRPTADIPVILCTAAIKMVREQEEIFKQKGIPVVYKPFDVDELLEVVQSSILAGKQMSAIPAD